MSDDQRRSDTTQAREGVPRHRVSVLGSFALSTDAAAVPLGVDSRRLIAYLAVHPRPQERTALAADLWPGVPAGPAVRMLADVVAGVGVPGLIAGADGGPLSLANDVEVDLAGAMGLVRALPDIPATADPDTAPLTSADILPGWSAAWLVVERERFRQLRLHAVEERSLRLTNAGRCAEAITMATVAVRTAPSRESARRALIEAYLAEGDVAAAVGQYDEYQELLRSSVGGPVPFGLDALLPPAPVWPVLRAPRTMPRSAVQLPRLRSVRGAGTTQRRLVAGGSVPGNPR